MFLALIVISIVAILLNKQYALFIWMLSSLVIPSFVRIYPIPVSFELVLTFFLFIFSVYQRINYGVEESYRTMEKWVVFFPLYYIIIRVIFTFLCGFYKPSDILVQSYCNVLFLSVMVFAVWIITDENAFGKVGRYISIALILVCIYGVSTYIFRENPYLSFLSKFTGNTKDFVSIAERYASETRGGLMSRISVLTYNPLQYAILLNAFVFVPIYLYVRKKNNVYLFAIILILINLFLTGSRGPLIALWASVLFFFLKYQSLSSKIKYIALIIGAFVLILFLPGFEKYASFVKSFIFIFDQSVSDAAEISGSSVSGRFLQLSGVWDIIVSVDSRTLLFGYGEGYTEYYLSLYGFGTDVMGFESILFSSLVNYGIIGFLLIDVSPWIFLFYCIRLLKKKNMISKKNSYILNSMLVTNIIYSFLVGSVYYIIYFSIFFCLMKLMVLENRKERIKCLIMLLQK